MSVTEADRGLIEAVRRQDVESARQALHAGANAKLEEELQGGRTPILFTSVASRLPPLVGLLLERGADPNAAREHVTSEGTIRTPCLYAAVPSVEIMQLLIRFGATARCFAAVGSRRYDILDHPHSTQESRDLLSQHAGGHADHRLLEAVRHGNLEAAREALDQGADANAEDWDRGDRTPAIFTACMMRNLDLVRLLLDRGADPGAVQSRHDRSGDMETPCLYAAVPSVPILKTLLRKGADLRSFATWDGKRYPVLKHPGMSTHVRRQLFSRCLSKDADGRLADAVRRGDLAAAQEALDEGAFPDPFLFPACEGRQLEIVTLLLERGADPRAGESEDSPMEYRWRSCLWAAAPDIKLMAALLKAGAQPEDVYEVYRSRDDVRTEGTLDRTDLTPAVWKLLGQYGSGTAKKA